MFSATTSINVSFTKHSKQVNMHGLLSMISLTTTFQNSTETSSGNCRLQGSYFDSVDSKMEGETDEDSCSTFFFMMKDVIYGVTYAPYFWLR